MVTSMQRSPEIQIINIQNNIKNNKINVKYDLNSAISEKQMEKHSLIELCKKK